MKTLNDTVRANRLDVFRHTLRSIALASAAASGLGVAGWSGCAATSSQSGNQRERAMSVNCGAIELTGLPLPPGVQGLVAYAWGPSGSFPAYFAGEFCIEGGHPDCGVGDAGFDRDEVFVRRAGIIERVSFADVVTLPVTSPAQATLLALTVDYHINCAGDPKVGVSPNGVRHVAGGFEVLGTRWAGCLDLLRGTVFVSEAGEVRILEEHLVEEYACPVSGRMTQGTAAPARPAGGNDVGRYFVQVAGLEAAAVDAFERMAAELQVLGAPVELVQWARASAEDERRHTRDMGALAERFAVKPAVHEAQQFALRGLFEVALENAVEGCVRETYGAVVGHHQARHAQDPVVRAGMARVAEDETRHAALSWAVAEWSLPQLTDAQRDVIRGAQRAAISALTRSVSIPEAHVLLRDAGLPAPGAALAMLQALGEQVWA
ncbi:MAG: ferritin-like domain-containing protein [Sandaracinaceae bacterium]|nr:ferritin-like domain-containing protein [Sandaracinaceae bacterium]